MSTAAARPSFCEEDLPNTKPVSQCSDAETAFKLASTACTGFWSSSIEKDPACPPQLPYRPVCSNPQASSTVCCQDLNASENPTCTVSPTNSACDSVLGNPSTGVCFAQSTNCGVNPNPASPGEPITSCPMMVSNEPGAIVCQRWCECNPAACNASMREYCSAPNHAQTPACACIAHQTPWGHLTFDDLQTIVNANPKVQQQLDSQGSGAINIGCVWPPCHGQASVLVPQAVDDTFACPQHIDDLCVNLVADVQFKDVEAGKITVGQCIEGGTGTGAGGKGNSQVKGGVSTLPFGTQLSVWLTRNPIIIIVASILFTIILATMLYLVFRPPTSLQLAEAEMTMATLQKRRQAKENLLMNTMLASTNATVRAAGRSMLLQRQRAAGAIKRHWQEQAKAIQVDIARLKPYASRNAQAGMQIAGLQAEAKMFRDQARSLEASLGIASAEAVVASATSTTDPTA